MIASAVAFRVFWEKGKKGFGSKWRSWVAGCHLTTAFAVIMIRHYQAVCVVSVLIEIRGGGKG